MKKNIKYYLIYLLIFLLGTSLSAALYYAYRICTVRTVGNILDSSALSLGEYIVFVCRFIRPLFLLFLSAFTIYACAVGAITSLLTSMCMGATLMQYCTSGMNPFTHIAALILLIGYALIYTYFSTECALYRSTLKSAAPDPAELLKFKGTLSLFYSFMGVCALNLVATTALYFFAIFFPI